MTDTKAALYLRLSREDADTAKESESIQNQRAFLLRYAEEHEYAVAGIFADDGYTGTNFDRPGFQRMIGEIEAGNINLVLTKDLSRFGRDYILTGHFLERYFPSKNVRFVAVNDGVDTFQSSVSNDFAAFRAVFNDLYAKDISVKVRSALLIKKKNGQFVGAYAPFGYQKDPADKNHLLIEEETAPVVKRMFERYLAGEPIRAIARGLTERGIPTPSERRTPAAARPGTGGTWSDAMVRRILTNPTYCGNLTQNRVRKVNYKVQKKVALPQSEWVTVPGTHQEIIGQEDFDAAQQMLRVRAYHKQRRPGPAHLLTGLAFCADCRSPMSTVREGGGRTYLVCSGWRKPDGRKRCRSHCIREDLVLDAIAEQLRRFAEQALDPEKLIRDLPADREDPAADKMLSALEKKRDRSLAVRLSLYRDKIAGIVSPQDYADFSAALQRETAALKAEIETVRESSVQPPTGREAAGKLKEALRFSSLSREALLLLVHKVWISEEKTITVEFDFPAPG